MKKISDKRLKKLGGKLPWSTVSPSSGRAPKKRKPAKVGEYVYEGDHRVKRKPRKKSERERIYGPPGYLEWIHEQPCITGCGYGLSECAHIETGGTGRKASWTKTVPLCGIHPMHWWPGLSL